MTSPTSALVKPKSLFNNRTRLHRIRQSRTGLTGLSTSSQTAFTCTADEVALIDRIVISTLTPDSATNDTVTLTVNGKDLPFHFPGEADVRRSERIILEPRGNWVVQQSQSFKAKATSSANTSVFVQYRRMPVVEASRLGYLQGGLLPSVASTDSVTAGGTSSGAAKNIVPVKAGYAVQVLSIVCTGHNFNSAEDNIRIGFWDGVGTFTNDGNLFCKVFAQNANPQYAPQVLIGDTQGCIQSASGEGVYIASTTNIAGGTPNADFVIAYRYIPEERIDVLTTDGKPGSNPSAMRRFWVFEESQPSVNGASSVKFFGTKTPEASCRILGEVLSTACANNASNSVAGIGLGNDSTLPISDMLICNSDGAATPADASRTIADDALDIHISTAQTPAFIGSEPASGVMNRTHLVWGIFDSEKVTGSDNYSFFA